MAILTDEENVRCNTPGSVERRCCGAAATVRRRLAMILTLGLLLRLVLAAKFGGAPPTIADAVDYNRLAVSLATTGRYVDDRGEPTSLRPPLYPALVAAVYRFAGVENFRAVALMQTALGLATVVAAYLLAAEAYSPAVGLAAAGATCFYPTLLAFNQFLLSETLFTLLVTVGAWLSLRVLKGAAWPVAVALGIVLGLGALTRSVLWLFSPAVAALVLLLGEGSRGRRAASAILVFAACAATIAPWAIRNTRLQQTVTFVDVMGGRNVMMGNYEYTPLDRSWATIESQTGDRAWHQVLRREVGSLEKFTQGQLDKAAMKHGVVYFFAHPAQSFLRSLVKFFNFWQLDREVIAGLRQGFFGQATMPVTLLAAAIVCGYAALTMWGFIGGAIAASPRSWRLHGMLLAWIGFPCLLHSIAFAHSRYRLPLTPIMLAYAAAFAVDWRRHWERRGSWQMRLAGSLCLLLTLAWLRELIAVDLKWFT